VQLIVEVKKNTSEGLRLIKLREIRQQDKGGKKIAKRQPNRKKKRAAITAYLEHRSSTGTEDASEKNAYHTRK